MTAPAQRGEAGRGHHVVLVWTRPYLYICAAFGGARSMSRRPRSSDAEPARGTEFHSLSARHRTSGSPAEVRAGRLEDLCWHVRVGVEAAGHRSILDAEAAPRVVGGYSEQPRRTGV